MKKWILSLSTLICLSYNTSAQFEIDFSASIEELTLEMAGSGVIISSIESSCIDSAKGVFSAENTNLGLDNGIVLSTGNVVDIAGPNLYCDIGISDGTLWYTAGDDDLNDIVAPDITHDACAIEFDFIPAYDTLSFEFVFGSEEYEEYVNLYNDVFAMYIEGGTEFPDKTNVALIPGTNTPIQLDSVNSNKNSAYFNSNCPESASSTLTYDGFTTVIPARVGVTPCETYHFKFVIADTRDRQYDSGIFIKSGSFNAFPVYIEKLSEYAVEGCRNGKLRFNRIGSDADTIKLKYEIKGTATSGLDYASISDSITLLPGETMKETIIDVIEDTITEGEEFIAIVFESPCANYTFDSIAIPIYDQLPYFKDDSIELCSLEDTIIGPAELVKDSLLFAWSPVNMLEEVNSKNPKLSNNLLYDSLRYVLNIQDTFGCEVDRYFHIYINGPKMDAGLDTTICPNDSIRLGAIINNQYNNSWIPENVLENDSAPTPLFLSNGKDYDFLLFSTDSNGCTLSDTVTIHAFDSANIFITANKTEIEVGEEVELLANGFSEFLWSPDNWLNCNTCPLVIASPEKTITYFIIAKDENGCIGKDSIKIEVLTKYIDLPKAFTPNGNGLNDFLSLVNQNISEFNYLRVFNRWGTLIFESNDINNGWDGTYKEKAQPIGNYYYEYEGVINDEVIHQEGTITLVR